MREAGEPVEWALERLRASLRGKTSAQKAWAAGRSIRFGKSERLDNDPRGCYGCFLPDLTGLARRLRASLSGLLTSYTWILQGLAGMIGVLQSLACHTDENWKGCMKLAETVTFGGSGLNRAGSARSGRGAPGNW